MQSIQLELEQEKNSLETEKQQIKQELNNTPNTLENRDVIFQLNERLSYINNDLRKIYTTLEYQFYY